MKRKFRIQHFPNSLGVVVLDKNSETKAMFHYEPGEKTKIMKAAKQFTKILNK